MQNFVKQIEEGVLELTVNLDKKDLNGYVDIAQRQMGADVTIPGFRKGKAPHEMVKQKLDTPVVREAAMELAVNDSLSKAISEQKLDVAGTEKLVIKENSSDKLTFSVALYVLPAVTLPNLGDIHVSEKEVHVSEKELSEALEVVRNMRANFSPKDLPAQEGDRVEVDFQVFEEGKLIEGGESRNHPLIIGGKNFMPGFEEQLVGLKQGEEKRFRLTAPADYYQKKIAGKELEFTVKIQLVQSVHLPQLDDEFAKNLGRFADMEGLKKNILAGITQEKKEKEKERARLEVLDKISEKVRATLPKFLVKQELDSMIGRFDRELHAKGLELPVYLAQVNKNVDDLKKEWEKDAVRQAKFALILRTLAKQQNIQANPQEVEDAVNQAAQALMMKGQTDMNELNVEQLKEHIREKLVQEKVFEYIEAQCIST